MNDRYLFKAKRVDNGEWVTGQYVNTCYPKDCKKTGHFIVKYPNHLNEIYTSTICQCTGLKDKNGNLIWENDILHNGNYFVVKWNESCSRFDIVLNNSNNIPIGKWEPMICDWKTSDFKEYRKAVDYEVIGNVFDNPELLESEKK